MLSGRAGTILNILVAEYINSAAPVASEEIARRSPAKVSPATVRTAMSRLADEGYISRPHVSAGAIPSDLGYRHYVQSLEEPTELPVMVQQKIYRDFSQAEPDLDTWSRQCATVLSDLTASLAVVTVPWAKAPRLKHIQLVFLEEFLALLIVVLQETRLLRRLLPVTQSLTQGILDQSANRLNDLFCDLDYDDIKSNQLELTPLETRVRHETTLMLKDASGETEPDHHVDGLRRLLDQPEFAQSGRAKAIVEMLEERVLLENLLPQMPETSDVAVYIGEENQEASLHPYGVILCQYGVANRATGTISVIGPTRMGYAEAIGGVPFCSSLMSNLVGELHRV